MGEITVQPQSGWLARKGLWKSLLLVFSILLSALALLMPYSSRQNSLVLEIGDVAGQDVLAPRALSYESEVLSEQQREEAAQAVSPIYGSPDSTVAREQVESLQDALAFIQVVRQDSFASTEQKLADISALQNINLGQERAIEILALGESAWQSVAQESVVVLEQVMRGTIRQDRLEESRSSVPALVSLSLPQDQAEIAAELASPFVVPNSFYSESLTEGARQEARDAVDPITNSYLSEETILQRGQVVSEADLEALEQFGLVTPEIRWQDYVGSLALILALFAIAVLYLRDKIDVSIELRSLVVIGVLFQLFLFAARLSVSDRTVIPYIFPVAGFGLLTSIILGAQPAIVLSTMLSLLVAYNLPTAFELTIYYLLGSIIGILVLGKAQRITNYLWAGAAVSIAGVAVLLAYRLPLASTDIVGLATLLTSSALNGFAAAMLTIVMQLALAQALGLTTTIQLLELSRPDHPLLQFILRNAPGTYQHSLQISNLAEQAAEAIGANALLTRVGSLYHDAGKARQPLYFIENQVPGSPNPHDELGPLESSAVIIRHVADGIELAKKHRLPDRIQDFIAEHHGTTVTRYQYGRAQDVAGDASKVKQKDFQYPGPRPQSRETALVMLADGCEARTRAERPETREELNFLVNSVISQRLVKGQLDNTSLTMQDLKVIEESFVSTLRGVYHPRIAYPKLKDEGSVEMLTAESE